MRTAGRISLLSILLLSCSKFDNNAVGLVGKWVPVMEYVSSGPPGQWVRVDQTDHPFLEFLDNGTIEDSRPTNGFPVHYQVISDSTIMFIFEQDTARQRYEIKGRTLTIWGLCLEGCATRYFKVNK